MDAQGSYATSPAQEVASVHANIELNMIAIKKQYVRFREQQDSAGGHRLQNYRTVSTMVKLKVSNNNLAQVIAHNLPQLDRLPIL